MLSPSYFIQVGGFWPLVWCVFGAKGNSYGSFTAPIGGNLVAVKLVHRFGYVSCNVRHGTGWSFWGCVSPNAYELVDTVITDSHNGIVMPPRQLEWNNRGYKWYKIPGYNSQSPEIVLSRFSSTPVYRGKRLHLWYGEDLFNHGEEDNGGRVCCKVYAMYS